MDLVLYSRMSSPLGPIFVAAGTAGLRRIAFEHGEPAPRPDPTWELLQAAELAAAPGTDRVPPNGVLTNPGAPELPHGKAAARRRVARILAEATRQLQAYFDGSLTEFDLPLDPLGTPFQSRVWAALRTIPYGTTWTYGELARRLNHPTASRAVGAANGRNPLPIVVPCHRVIGSDGSLTGYAGGLHLKVFLLDLERGAAPSQTSLL
jgi:methylated-DNA-[protein]-cysteine S-methyltransferase